MLQVVSEQEWKDVGLQEPLLHLGCGDVRLIGAVNLDQQRPVGEHKVGVTGMDYFQNIVTLNGFPNNMWQTIYSAHALQCLDKRTQVVPALKRWFALLRSGGRLVLEVPDIRSALARYLAEEISLETLNLGIFGWDEPGLRQVYVFDFKGLTLLLESVGFVRVSQCPQPAFSHHCKESNLCVEAYKP